MFVKYADHLKPPKTLTRPHKGLVIDNLDPKKLGRVKCTIGHIYVGAKEVLPWVYPKHTSSHSFSVPKIGDELLIEFPFGDIYHPFYTGNWYNAESKDEYFETNYPNCSGFVYDSIKARVNDETKEAEIEHASGTKAVIKEDGTLEVTLAKDVILTCEGKHSVNAKGDIEFTSDANFKVVGKGGVDISTDAEAKFVGKGGTTVGDSGGTTKVEGSVVNIAGGGAGVALMGSQCSGVGNMGAPVMSNIIEGSSKVFAPK